MNFSICLIYPAVCFTEMFFQILCCFCSSNNSLGIILYGGRQRTIDLVLSIYGILNSLFIRCNSRIKSIQVLTNRISRLYNTIFSSAVFCCLVDKTTFASYLPIRIDTVTASCNLITNYVPINFKTFYISFAISAITISSLLLKVIV